MDQQAFITFSFVAEDARYAAELASYEATAELLVQQCESLGIDGTKTVPDLDESERELLAAMSPSNETVFAKPDFPPSRLSFVLFGDAAPRAVENFLRLCDGTKGIAKASKKPLHYLGNRVHRIVEGYCVQWGDIVRNDGSGGESIYGGKFNDEPAALKLPISRGSLVMANSGKNSNTSQVFVVLTDDVERIKKNMQGKHVVIGRILGFGGEACDEARVKENLAVMTRLDAAKEGTELMIKECGVISQ